jgi:NarL family two-component system response regulator LiaR
MIRVLIADDHKVVRQGLAFLLSQEAGIEVAGEAADGVTALEAIRRIRPDVVLLDLFMPRLDGLAVLAAMREQQLTAAVLVLTSSSDDEHLVQAVRSGALSYLPKTAGVDQVIESVRAAARGESVLQPAATARLLRELRQGPAPLGQLTPRETDVLKALARGRSNREIARSLSVTEETVKSHVSSILAKLGLADRTQAAIYALQHHLVPLDQALESLPRPAVVGGAARLYLADVLLRPYLHGADRPHQAFPERSELVLDPHRHAGREGAGDQAVPFQGAKRLGEHLLAHASDDPAQVAVPLRALRQGAQDQRDPLVADPREHLARRAGREERVVLRAGGLPPLRRRERRYRTHLPVANAP